MAATVVIPARFGSTRFPAKIVAAETGKPLVQHVVDQVRQCKRVRQIIVATDDQRIVDALKPFGTTCQMTSPTHQSGTDRIAEVARGLNDEILVNVQGDEPEIEPEIVDALIERLETSSDDMATAATPFLGNAECRMQNAEGNAKCKMQNAKSSEGADWLNPNLVKVVVGIEGRAIYFSRAPIPYWRDAGFEGNAGHLLHLGIYAYRRQFLLEFAGWKPTPLEQTEKLEQLRALEHGASIFVLQVRRATHGIDTPEQYAEFVARYRKRDK